jgi:DNA polymerase III subunit delta
MKKPEPLYLLVGPEEGEKRQFIDDTLESYRKAAGEEPELHRFYAGQTKAEEIIALIKNGSLFSSYKFVIFSGIESCTKGEVKSLVDYAKKPDETASLFLLSEEYRSAPSLDKAVTKERKKIFFELFENRKREWLFRYFDKAGVGIDEEAVEVLLELVENNTLEMKIAADRLILFFGEKGRIEAEEVEEFIYHSKEENVFTLFGRLVYRDLPGSLEVLRKILLSGGSSGVQLLGGLLWQFRRLLDLSLLLDRNYSPDEAFAVVAVRGKRNQRNYLEGSRNYRSGELERAVTLLADYDGMLRRYPSDIGPLLLDMCIYRITGGR